MQLPWRSLRKPAGRRAAVWPPSAVQWLASAMAAVFVAQCVTTTDSPGWDPLKHWGALSLDGLRDGQYWRLATHLFLAPGTAAEVAAFFGLFVCGRHLEAIIGRRHLVQLFFLAGVAGALPLLGQDDWVGDGSALIAGATPAVAGIFFGLVSVMPELEFAPFGGFHAPPRLKIKHCALGLVLVCAGLLADPRGLPVRNEAMRCLVGCVAGWFYLRQLGFGRWKVREPEAQPTVAATSLALTPATRAPANAAFAQREPRFTERELRMTPQQYISEQIDPILDKICLHGIGALTVEERRMLEKARDKIGRKGA